MLACRRPTGDAGIFLPCFRKGNNYSRNINEVMLLHGEARLVAGDNEPYLQLIPPPGTALPLPVGFQPATRSGMF